MFELPRTGHRAGRNSPVVAGNEIHQSEIEGFDSRQRGDFPDFAQRTEGFDQYMHRDFALQPGPRFGLP